MPDLSAPQQQVSVIPNKVDKDGHHYLKVLLLSNKLTKNNWIAPYNRIGDLPQELLDSYMEIPGILGHNHEFFDRLDDIFKQQGMDRQQRYELLRKESKENGNPAGYIDHIFMEDPDSSKLYGQFKVTDPAENEYIAKYEKTSQKFTSPAISGVYQEDENGIKTYDVNTMRAFHLGFLAKPAFDEEDAEIKGICKNGNSESCREALAYAGDDSPIENVNKTCGCNNNINMSNNNTKVETQPDIPSNEGNIPQGKLPETKFANQPEVKYTIEEKISDDPKYGTKSNIVEKTEVFKSEREIEAEAREKELQATIKELQKRDQERNDFFLNELLTTHIPRENFKKDEEYDGEKTNIKNFILKYNVSLEDAKWFIKKSVPKVVEVEPAKTKDKNQYAGTMFDASSITKPIQAPKPSQTQDNDYPIGF